MFAGETDIDQLGRIIARLGSPDEAAWPAVRGLPDYAKLRFAPAAPAPLAEALPDAPAPALDLLARLLRWNPGAARPLGCLGFRSQTPAPLAPDAPAPALDLLARPLHWNPGAAQTLWVVVV